MAFPRQRLPPLGHILREPIPCLIPKGGIYRSPTGEDPVGMPYEQEGNPMPQPFKNAVMTNAGANLLTRAQLGSTQIEFTRMATGNGTYNEDEKRLDALQQQESLKSEKNSYALSSIHIHTEKSIKITALITNQDPDTEETLVEEGYYINEVGLYAKELGGDSSTEVLYSISVTSGENGDFMPPYNGFSPAQIIQDYYVTVNNSAEVTIKSGMGAVALADDLQNLNRAVEQQNIAAQEQFQQQYEQLTGYTDTKIGELINGAPETLDTIKEVADAILENETIVEALNEAVGKKLNKDGDLTDTTVTFTSEDDEDPTAWTAMRKIVSGKLKDILGSVSTMAKNLNYLRKMLGTEDISKMGDGTLTGAVSKLNTDISKANEVKYYSAPEPPTNNVFLGFAMWVFRITKVGRVVTISMNIAGNMAASDENNTLLVLPVEYTPYDEYKITSLITQDKKRLNLAIYHDGAVRVHNFNEAINGWLLRFTITYIARE